MVVDEAAEQAREDWIKGSLGLRLALAHLCSIADGPTFNQPSRRAIFDQFWETVTKRQAGNPNSARYARVSITSTCLEQIGRQIGCGAYLFNAVRAAREKDARKQFADAVKQADRERDDAGRTKRANYWGPPRP